MEVEDLGYPFPVARVYECDLQLYIKDNADKLFIDLVNVKGPHKSGPDLTALSLYECKEVKIEVEWDPQNYLAHGHHRDPRFRDVEFLVCLDTGVRPAQEKKGLLPSHIIYVDSADFTKWFYKKYNLKAEIERLKLTGQFEEAKKYLQSIGVEVKGITS